jgi:ribose-phosphate pyrophosphokinase
MDSIIFYLEDRPELKQEIHDRLSETVAHDKYPNPYGVHAQVFADGEVCVDYNTSVRGKRVFILSSPNTSDKLMQLNLAIDAAKRASAKEIIPILPYFPYARQDKKDQTRGPIGAKVVAEMLENRGATQVITLDLHADQIQGFFNIPVTHLEGKFLFDKKIFEIYTDGTGENFVLCSPDAGGAKRVKGVRDRMKEKYNIDIPMVMIDKTRSEANKVDEMVLIGDVKGKHVVIVDDMADTCGTLVKASESLKEMGAKSVRSIVTHGILSGPAKMRLFDAIEDGHLDEFICSNSLPIKGEVVLGQGKYFPVEAINN